MQPVQNYQFVIIGAGIGGLQAALILSEFQKNFVILQATPLIGGRIGTQYFGEVLQKQHKEVPKWARERPDVLNVPIQYGATWIAQGHTYMKKLVKMLGLNIFEQVKKGRMIYGQQPGKYQQVNELSQIYDKQTLEQLQEMLNKIHKLHKKFQVLYQQAIQNNYPDKMQQYKQFISKYDSMSVLNFMQQHFDDKELISQFCKFIQCMECIDCDRLSMMQVIDSDEGLGILWEASGWKGQQGQDFSDDGYRVRQGSLEIVRKLFKLVVEQVRKYKNILNQTDVLKLNHPVTKIQTWPSKESKQCKVHVQTPNGPVVYSCRRVINSIPLATMARVQITNLSIPKKIFFNNQQKGNVHRVYMVFKEPFWRGKCNGYGLFSDKFPFNQMTDISPANNSIGILVFVFYVDKYQKWVSMHPDGRYRFEYLRKVVADMFLDGDLNSPYLEQVVNYTRTYFNNQYIQAGYQSSGKLGVWKAIQDTGQSYADIWEKDQNGVSYIGSQLDQQHGSFMEGALRNARRKVYHLMGKSDPWKE